MSHTWKAVLVLLAGAGALHGAPPIPTVVKAEPAPEWTALFAGKNGWIGGDGIYSTNLAPNRILWLFGDTLLGKARDGKRDGATMVNNTVGIQALDAKDKPVHFTAGKTSENKPAALITPADGKGWFWPHAALRIGPRLYIFLPRIEKTKEPGVLGFKQTAQVLAVVENPDDDPEKWRTKQHPLPFAVFTPERERSWGSGLIEDAGFIYIYGFDEEHGQRKGRRLTVARAPTDKLADFASWRFRTTDGWSEKATDSAQLAEGLATEFSVSPLPGNKGFAAVYTENGLGDRIVARFAEAPEGPWSTPVLLYKCPEMAKDKGVFSYAGKAHPWAVTGNELLLSYCVNTWEFARLFRDDEVYRPKFVRVELGPPLRDK